MDSKEIGRSERIQALQSYPEVAKQIQEQEKAYLIKRRQEKEEAQRRIQEKQEKKKKNENQKKYNPGYNGRWYTDINNSMYVFLLAHFISFS